MRAHARLAAGALALGLASLAAGCAVGPRTPEAAPTVSMRMRGAPADATVIIDDQVLGTLELVMARGVALPAGVHYITVKAPGYFPWDREVEARLGTGPIQLEAKLVPVPD